MPGSSALFEADAGEPFLNQQLSFLVKPQNSAYGFLTLGQNSINPQVNSEGTHQEETSASESTPQARRDEEKLNRKPREERLVKANSFNGDLRDLPYRRPVKRERPEREEPEPNPTFYPGTSGSRVTTDSPTPAGPAISAPAPAPSASFDGLDFANWGAGHPPDTNGDVGPTYYIQTVNTSIGIFRKSDGVRVAAFTFDTFMSQGNFGNLCDTNNFGDPVVLYDSFEDRWIISDFAFSLDGAGNVLNPPGAFQCIAASKTGDPVSGGWNFYSINTSGGLGDYPKFGIWPDGLYMSVNMFDFAASGSFQNPRVYAFNKAQMYAGSPTVQSVSFDAPPSDFTLLPSNARLQTGTPPPGTPNYFVSTWQFLNGLSVYKFHVDWERISLSTFSGPDVPLSATSWPNASVPNAPSLGGNSLDVLEIRAMMQNQYSNIGGAESLWTTHTVRRGNTSGFAAPRWYQVDVTGGTVAANIPQAATWDPDGANVIYRFMPSLAIDRMGDMALGYSTSSSTTKPAIKYAGRLAADPINTLGQTEQVLIQGTGTQTGNCGGSPCSRWGDYSAMSLDPNGCSFWYTNEYYAVDGLNDLTRIGSFGFPQCTPVVAVGTVSGTVTDSVTTLPINGAKVKLGSRTTTTNALGNYSFTNLPPGNYSVITASSDGYGSSTATSIVVAGAATTTQSFSLTAAPLSACFADTSQADFQTGVATDVDLTSSPGDIILFAPANVDQQNQTVTTSGFGFTSTSWAGQTFTAGVTGTLSRLDLDLFCSGCTGTTPNLIVSIRATSGNPAVPTGPDIAIATISGFSTGSGGYFSANFDTPTTLTAGSTYAVIIRATSDPSVGSYAYVCSCSAPNSNPYSSGQRVTSTNSGSTWSADNVAGGRDLGFIAYMKTGFASAGNFISGAQDANAPADLVTHWTTLSWNAITPANTAIKFQGAGSNSLDGPFNFVGPDSTAATFFTNSGASLAQFNGFRYLKYKAFLSTTLNTATPTLNDVTVCFSDGTPTITAAAPLLRQQGANATSQIATVSDPFQPANTLVVTATPLTGTGITINSINVDAAGNVTANVAANCVATSSTFTLTVTNNDAATATATLTVNVTPSVIPTITPSGPTTFCQGGSVTLTSSSATANQWYLNGNPIGGATNQQFVANATGNYSVSVTELGCVISSVATPVTVNPVPSTPTITPSGPTTFCQGGSVTLTSSSASGNQWYLNGNPIGSATNQQFVATATGNYTTIVTSGGCSSSPSVATVVTVNPTPPTPTITPNGPTTFFQGGSVTLTSSSASGNQWYMNGNPIGGATTQYIATVSGNYTVATTTNGCTSATSAATLVTVNPVPVSPTITKAFNPAIIPLNSISTLSFTLSNSNTTSGLSGVGFTDSLPAGLVVAPTPNVTGSCGSGTITAIAGSSSVSLSAGTLTASPVAGSTCTFTVGVKGTTSGTKLNTTSAIISSEAGTGATSNTAAITVVAPPALAKLFNPTTIAPGVISILTISVTNPGSNTIQLNGVGFTDNFPANLVVASPNGLVNTCGGTATAAPGSGSVSLTGATIPINSSCSVSVAVTSSLGGLYVNNTNPVSSSNGGTGNFASATLHVVAPPTITKLFQPNTVVQNGTTLMSFTVSNPNTNASLTGITFTDNLPAGLLIASPNNLTNACGGTFTAIAGSSSIGLLGGTLGPASNPTLANCVISVTVKAPNTLGTLNNTTGPIFANESGPGVTSNSASMTVIATPVPPTIAKNFGVATIPFNGTTSLTFTLANPNSALTLSNISATDTLPPGLVVATPNRLSGNCTGSITANAGGNTIGIAALNLAASSSCSFSVDVSGMSVGTKNNTTGSVSATYVIGGGSPVPISGSTATANINVVKADQTISFNALPNKIFGDADFIVSPNISSGLPVSLSASGNCTVTSPSPGTVHITGAGSCTITASQGGDGNYKAAPNVLQSFSIAQAATTSEVSTSINPSDKGQNVVFTATVTAPNTTPPTGAVQFKDGAINLGAALTCAVVGNTCKAQFSISTLTAGTHAISAVYSGDANFTGGTSVLSGGQVVTNLPTLQLILEEFSSYPNLAASLDSLLLLRDPFPIKSLGTWYFFGPDQNTRVMVFVASLQLNSGESSSVVVVHLIDSNNQSYDVPAEDVRTEPITGFAQVTFRLPDTLFPGDCAVQVKAHSQVSNSAIIRIAP
ncbi:MAG TPA: Ig-like domain repeat protein [Pyrinomonadaceae bacterium]|nr:Ig-like domain repeat protein [Pyrinomonadaceae bacterium]